MTIRINNSFCYIHITLKDAMTADWAKLPNSFLEKVSNKIINEVKGVNRVLYDVTQKPPGTIEYE